MSNPPSAAFCAMGTDLSEPFRLSVPHQRMCNIQDGTDAYIRKAFSERFGLEL